MSEAMVTDAAEERLERLLQLLESDPGNLPLLADAADAALAERRPDLAAQLLDRYAAIAPLPDPQVNLAGLAALQLKQFGKAAELFGRLMEGDAGPAVRFNLAWARAMEKDFKGALELLDEQTTAELPQAAMLNVQLLHELGAFDEAAALARGYVRLHPSHPGLMAAVSVLALDVEDAELAEACAARAPDHPDALSTMGILALGKERATEALEMFDRAIERREGTPRAWIGRGLAKLLTGEGRTAPADVDRGAEMFADHLGSWIAAGWAYFINGDMESSRARFEKALQIDANFAEAHGSLAVIELLEGKTEEARRRSDVALRLDRNCYSGALARSLLAAGAGNPDEARRIFERALNTPVDGSGRTIARALTTLGFRQG